MRFTTFFTRYSLLEATTTGFSLWLARCLQRLFGFIPGTCVCNALSLTATSPEPLNHCPRQFNISKPSDPKNTLFLKTHCLI